MEFGNKLPQTLRGPAGAGSGAPRQEQSLDNQSSEDQLPDEPLLLEDIEHMDEGACLKHIESRHHLSRDNLFKHVPSVDHRWDSGYLAKVALMHLEGVSRNRMADFFSEEFSLLYRKNMSTSTDVIAVTVSKYFSDELKEKIQANVHTTWWGIAANLEDRSLISQIEIATGLSREELFPEGLNKQAQAKFNVSRGAHFNQDAILRAFLMRIKGEPYEVILSTLNVPPSEKGLHNQLAREITYNFSEQARALLPYNHKVT